MPRHAMACGATVLNWFLNSQGGRQGVHCPAEQRRTALGLCRGDASVQAACRPRSSQCKSVGLSLRAGMVVRTLTNHVDCTPLWCLYDEQALDVGDAIRSARRYSPADGGQPHPDTVGSVVHAIATVINGIHSFWQPCRFHSRAAGYVGQRAMLSSRLCPQAERCTW